MHLGRASPTGAEPVCRRSRGSQERSSETYEALPILNTVALQTEHLPRVAGLPFFNVTCSASLMSRWARHFRQYACMESLQR